MSDDTDSWLQNAFGFNVAEAAQNVVEAVAPVVQSVEQAVAPVVQSVEQTVLPAVQDFGDAVAPAVQGIEAAGAPVLSTVADAGRSFAEGVKSNIQGRLDGVTSGYQGVKDAGVALVAPIPDDESAGDAALDVLHRGYNMAKSIYTGVGAVKDAIVPPNPISAVASLIPDANTASRKLNEGVDAVEEMAKGNSALYATAQAVGGVVKGVGDMAAMTSNILVHPIDNAPKVFEGMEGIVEHTHLPGTDGLKALHGLYDVATDNKQGKYGSTLEEVNKNIHDGTERDSSDPSKWVDSDTQFGASFGGGIKAWEDKPMEAAARTITNIAPMLFGEAKGIPSEGLPAVAGEVPVVPELPRAGVAEPIPVGEVRGAPAAEAGSALDPHARSFAEADTQLPEPSEANFADAPTDPALVPKGVSPRARTLDMKLPEVGGDGFATADTQLPEPSSVGDFADAPTDPAIVPRGVSPRARTLDLKAPQEAGGDLAHADTQIPETEGGDFVDADTEAQPQPQGRRVAKTVDMQPSNLVDPYPKGNTQIPGFEGADLSGNTEIPGAQGRRVAKTVDMQPSELADPYPKGDTQPGGDLSGDTEVPVTQGRRVARTLDDIPEARPRTEPGSPLEQTQPGQGLDATPADPADAFNTAEKNFGNARANARAASDASYKATAEWAEYRRDVNRPDFDPSVDAELGRRADALGDESLKAHNKMKATKQAYEQVGGMPALDVPGRPTAGAPAGRAGGTARFEQPVDAQPGPPVRRNAGGTIRLEPPPKSPVAVEGGPPVDLPGEIADGPPLQPDPTVDGQPDPATLDPAMQAPPDEAPADVPGDGAQAQPDAIVEEVHRYEQLRESLLNELPEPKDVAVDPNASPLEQAKQAYENARARTEYAAHVSRQLTQDAVRFEQGSPYHSGAASDGRIWSGTESAELKAKFEAAQDLVSELAFHEKAALDAYEAQQKAAGMYVPKRRR